MNVPLEPGVVVRLADLTLGHDPVDPAQTIKGAPMVGSASLATLGDVEVGVWECTAGASTDTEVDEIFVVISGRARIDFTSPALPSSEVGPGDLVRLAAGMQTVWTVTQTLRKVYIASGESAATALARE